MGDEPGGPGYIETVARRGYRFVAAVRTVSTDESLSPAANEVYLPTTIEVTPVLAVLPFIDATGDQEVEYLAHGVTENITNNLARVSKLRVMSRSTVFCYHTKEVDPQQLEDIWVHGIISRQDQRVLIRYRNQCGID